jgi:drug/metabolite transporter (DMT)-like permease
MVAGIIFSLLSSITLNTGNVVQKHAVASMPPFSPRQIGHLIRTLAASPLWVFGFALCIVGIVLQVMAFALAPIPVVQSIFNAGIVLLLVLSRFRLGERLRRIEWVGIAVVIMAVTAVAVTLNGTTGSLGVTTSGLRLFVALAPTCVLAAIVVALLRSENRSRGFMYGMAAGLLYGAAALGTKGASTLVVRHGVWHSIPGILASPYPYVFVGFSVLAMVIYQTGLQRARISVVGTMSDVVCSTYVVAVGVVVFNEALPHDRATLFLRLGGFAGVLLGSIFVAAGGRQGEHASVPVLPSEGEGGANVDPGVAGAGTSRGAEFLPH